MPAAIAAFVAYIGVTGVAATILTSAIEIGLTVGLSFLTNALFGPSQPKPSDGQQVLRVAIGSRVKNYGIVHSAGQLSYEDSASGTLGIVQTLGTGQEGEILEHRINDIAVTVDAGGTITDSSFHRAIHIYTRSGLDDQTAIAEVTAKFPAWTVNHRQRGCAVAALICDPVKQEQFSEVYQSREPEYTQVRKCALVYDPRKDDTAGGVGPQRLADKSTWAWADNAALVIADFMACADAYGIGYDNVNWQVIAAEADIADELVTTVTGAIIPRWRLWGSFNCARDDRGQVLAAMLKACDGFCWQDANSKFCLMLGRYEAPTVVITDAHITSLTATLGPKAQYRTNAVKVLYTEAAVGYREQESATVAATDLTVDPNTDPQAIEAYWAPHHNQAVRIGKINLARLGERWHLNMTVNLVGLALIGERFFRMESAALGVSADFVIEGLKLNPAAKTIEVTATEIEAEDWAFNAATEEGTPPLAPTPAAYGTATVPVPDGIVLAAVQIVLADTNGVAIAVSWADLGRPDLRYDAHYRPSAGGDWIVMTVDSTARTARSGAVDSGTEYEVQVRSVTYSGWASAWSASVLITPDAIGAALAAPSDLAATGASGSATVTLRLPTGATFSYARLYHATSATFSSATQVGADIIGALGEVMTITDSGLSAGTEYYWAQAFDASGDASALAGPVTATIT